MRSRASRPARRPAPSSSASNVSSRQRERMVGSAVRAHGRRSGTAARGGSSSSLQQRVGARSDPCPRHCRRCRRTPTAFGRARSEPVDDAADGIDRDIAGHALAVRLHRSPQQMQVGMGLGHHAPRRRILFRHRQAFHRAGARQRIARSQQEARRTIGKARLADAFGAAEKPGVMQALRAQRIQELRSCRACPTSASVSRGCGALGRRSGSLLL